MKKTLLMAAAALAAGVITSQAQVYSQNVVGYVNVQVASGFNLINNPMVGATNKLSALLPAVDGSQVLIWNGLNGYATYTFDTTQWVDDNYDPADPTILPGLGFFYYSPGSNTLSFAGNTYANPGTSSTNTVLGGFRLVGSQIPYGGAVTNSTFNLPGQDGAQVLKWNGLNGYATYTFDTTQWVDDNYDPSVPQITVGQGFFYYNPSSSVNWVQTLAP